MKKFLFVALILVTLITLVGCGPAPKFVLHQVLTLNSGNSLISTAASKVGIDGITTCHPSDGQQFEVDQPPLQDGSTFWYEVTPLNQSANCTSGWIGEFSIPHQ